MEPSNKKRNNAVPIAIIIVGVVIAGALVITGSKFSQEHSNAEITPNSTEALQAKLLVVTKEDHVLGNPNAPITIFEYSDTECPFCKRFHATMLQVMEDYGKAGEVAWVYRHFPLENIHPNAPKEAEAIECAGELGGNDSFWKYLHRLTTVTPTNNGLDQKELPDIATYIGLDSIKFSECLQSGRHAGKIQHQFGDGVELGVSGTPSSFVVHKDGRVMRVTGGYPYVSVRGPNMKNVLDLLLHAIPGQTPQAK